MNLNFNIPTKIISEPGCVGDPGTFEKLNLQGTVLLVTDPVLVQLGIAGKVIDALESVGLKTITYDQVTPEPNVSVVHKALKYLANKKIDVVLGLGGGSPMDIAKIISLLVRTPQPIENTFGVDNCQGARLPLILIPTTAGTGSEVTHVAVVTGDNEEKSPIVDTKLICDVVLLDPEITIGLPKNITAATGVDAMVHAIEAYTSGVKKNVISDQLALQAFNLLYHNIYEAVHNGNNLVVRSNMLIGAMLAGLAFANATVGAVHALSYPLGTNFKIAHGESNALVMIPVMHFNSQMTASLYAQLCRKVHPEMTDATDKQASDYLLDKISALIPSLGLHRNLKPYGIGRQHLDLLTDGALKQDRLLSYNYREMNREEVYRIFEQLI